MTQAVTLASIANSGYARNRIINGNMVIDQRNAGASVTPTDGQFLVDRWFARQTTASKFSAQQNAGSVTPPEGFNNYIGCTSLSAYAISATDVFAVVQNIEGLNVSDLAWGTASASPITISFWVRSSLTGVFGGSLRNSGSSRTYPFSYSISSANTWEKKAITIAGDTTGTWLKTNGIGIQVIFSIGTGSTFSGTAGSWSGSNFLSATGATSVVGTNGATFYLTGVQLEVGTQATPYEWQSYDQQLAACQRYYWQYAAAGVDFQEPVVRNSATAGNLTIVAPVSMRALPVAALGSSPYGRVVGYDSSFNATSANVTGFSVAVSASTSSFQISLVHGSVSYAAAATSMSFDTLNATSGIGMSAEL
jgi:hypothetical protein